MRVVLSLSSLAAGSSVHPLGLLSIFSSTTLLVGRALQAPSRSAARGSEVRARRCILRVDEKAAQTKDGPAIPCYIDAPTVGAFKLFGQGIRARWKVRGYLPDAVNEQSGLLAI